MSYKRSRSTYEADRPSSSFVTFGTPLPDDSSTRDDGSYVPLWKQDVRDDRGRKRLHGAFTGGWSAGYYNTVGSKEGWTPSTFVSSRSDRRKDDAAKQQRPEDFMDEEDLAAAAEAQKIQTSDAFAGIGGVTRGNGERGLAGLFRTQGDTMGLRLLRKMGWKDGQGIGPKVRRRARLDTSKANADDKTYLFAPDDVTMIQLDRKKDRKGLGHQGVPTLSPMARVHRDDDGDDEATSGGRPKFSLVADKKKGLKPSRTGIGVGVLNDNGSDEEDPYEIGPRIKYNRVIGGDKKKKKQKNAKAAVNPSIGSTPVFVPKTARAGGGLGRCHDGRLPLDGFVLAKLTEDFASLLSQYLPPAVPEGWTSAVKQGTSTDENRAYASTSDTAKASTLDPKARAALLGEKQLPGKSVFDYISPLGRDKLATAAGRTDLPQGMGEVPEEYRLSEHEKLKRLWSQVPKLDRETAVAALSRSAGGPYADDEAKKARYREYLEGQADDPEQQRAKPRGMTDDEYLREMGEFYNCARIFKPMTGFMASRFTTAKKTSGRGPDVADAKEATPEKQVGDPAEEAARMGMYGNLTRSVATFYPTRLLCKRFNVRPPAHVKPDKEAGDAGPRSGPSDHGTDAAAAPLAASPPASTGPAAAPTAAAEPEVDPDRNDAKSTISSSGPSESSPSPSVASSTHSSNPDAVIAASSAALDNDDSVERERSPPPRYPASESSSSSPRPPPPFSSLFTSYFPAPEASSSSLPPPLASSSSGPLEQVAAASSPAYEASASASGSSPSRDHFAETKKLLPRDTKPPTSKDPADDAEPPPAYEEGDSPLLSFTYVMAAAGGASSIITQVQQGGPPINSIGDVGADETIAMDLRGTRFVLSRDELLTLPEFVLLSLFPNGLFPEGHMGGLSEGDAVQVDYDPASLQYMLDFFRDVAQTIPSDGSPGASQDGDVGAVEPMGDSKRAGIIVLREDLDFYAIPPSKDISPDEMLEVKRAAARVLQSQAGIFTGLKRGDEPGTTEAHLIEMLTAGGFDRADHWGHRAGEPHKAVICSLALARLRSDIRGNDVGGNAVGMAQKLLLFWRKPARRCWWEGVELDDVDGVEGKLKVWIRRVWTLEMSVIGLR
ncbi:G patch domain-containing protein 1 [Geosmithia morbida]|uniref:G patch domain-containing protein 1 n=1 Tax=Geosmithia morbida TaxID=1094350 RepID=A0A9P4YS62_9HYPO|nr:G patch domain-containing protein 1 [Geosmithia morbida]KAF4122136.1 G patch domain-containing protein 1 [Geosmithia morbida]